MNTIFHVSLAWKVTNHIIKHWINFNDMDTIFHLSLAWKVIIEYQIEWLFFLK